MPLTTDPLTPRAPTPRTSHAPNSMGPNVPDVVSLAQALIRCKSITPHDAGCMDIIQNILEPLGFVCHRVTCGDVTNFYARWGTKSPHLCFLGHTDVVPAPDPKSWTHDPFAGVIENGVLFGRGAVDMKGAVACFVTAAASVVSDAISAAATASGEGKISADRQHGSISILLTSDEEGPAKDGVKRMIPWLRDRGETFDICIGGEPTNPTFLGEMMKVGRRGSLTMHIVVEGKAGHVAYPEFAYNPTKPLINFLNTLTDYVFDDGTNLFDPTHLEITTIDVGNPTSNMIPARASATVNVRFSPHYTLESLQATLQQLMDEAHAQHATKSKEASTDDPAFQWHATFAPTGDSFYNPDETFTAIVSKAVQHVTGTTPVSSTSGGTSDARFMKDLCPVVEFGLQSCYAHQVDERVSIADLEALTEIYKRLLNDVVF